jgi:REP element-mobilizing transposase RayT
MITSISSSNIRRNCRSRRWVNALKGTSSRLLRKEMPHVASRYWKVVLWTPSYFAASAGGAPQRASSPA